MTSRTNGHSEGQHQAGHLRAPRAALELRRQEALERYLAGDPIEGLCQELSCSKSWLYKWKKRYQVTDPDWVQEHSRRPQRSPTKTPDTLEAEIVWLRQALSLEGSGTVSADVMQDHLRQHGGGSIPSRRTIYRLLKRQAREEKEARGLDNSGNIEGSPEPCARWRSRYAEIIVRVRPPLRKPRGDGGIYVRLDQFLDWIHQETGVQVEGPLG